MERLLEEYKKKVLIDSTPSWTDGLA